MFQIIGTVGIGLFVEGMLNHYAPDMENLWFTIFGVQCAYWGIVMRLK